MLNKITYPIVYGIVFLIGLSSYSQILIGVTGELGESFYKREVRGTLEPGIAWSAGINFYFATSKRINPFLNVGFSQKNYSTIMPHPPQIEFIEKRTLDEIFMNIGARFNILTGKHKIFVDLGMNNNYILKIKTDFYSKNGPHGISYDKADSPFYVGCLIGAGYNYNNKFSISFNARPALTSFDNIQLYTSRLNTYCMSLCYYLPVLTNRKLKPLPVKLNEP